MSEKIYSGKYYKLTEEDKDEITKCFNDRNLKAVLEYCDALAMVASFAGWRYAELYLEDVGLEKFFRSCSNCGRTFDCEPGFAIDICGDRYKEWVPMSEEGENRLKELRSRLHKEL